MLVNNSSLVILFSLSKFFNFREHWHAKLSKQIDLQVSLAHLIVKTVRQILNKLLKDTAADTNLDTKSTKIPTLTRFNTSFVILE